MKRSDHEKYMQEWAEWLDKFLGPIYKLKKNKTMIKVTIFPILNGEMLIGTQKTVKLFGLTVKTKTLLYPKAQNINESYNYHFI